MGSVCTRPTPIDEPTQQQPQTTSTTTHTADSHSTTQTTTTTAPTATTTTTSTEMSAAAPTTTTTTSSKAKIAVIYYSMYGHIAQLAAAIAKGVESAGAEVTLLQVPETLTQDVLDKMHAPAKNASVRVIEDVNELEQYDGFIFGLPTRFGVMAAQMKAFFDKTGGLWMRGALVGKTAGVFFSTASQGGGQETTALTTLTQFAHHGMVYVPIGYTDQSLLNLDEIHGGSPYGAGTFAGSTGARQPTPLELGVATHQGKHIATITIALKAGRAAVASHKTE